jgi:peptide deformylase
MQARTKNTVLRKIARPLTAAEIKTPKMQSFFDNLITTMFSQDGVGLAAPQVGQSVRVLVVRQTFLDIKEHDAVNALTDYYLNLTKSHAEDVNKGLLQGINPSAANGEPIMMNNDSEDDDALIIINPLIKRIIGTKTNKGKEGCLSVPGYIGMIDRHDNIEVEYTTREGQSISRQLCGFGARLFQHERDHLDGILFIDHIKDAERDLLVAEAEEEEEEK